MRLYHKIAEMKKCLLPSQSQKESYAAVLGYANSSRRLEQVYNGQPKKKPNTTVIRPARSSRKLVEVYNGDTLYLTGIAMQSCGVHPEKSMFTFFCVPY